MMNNNLKDSKPKDNKLKIVILDIDKEEKKVRFDSLKIGDLFYIYEINKPKRCAYVKTSKSTGVCINGINFTRMSCFSDSYMVMYKSRIIGLDTTQQLSNFYEENGIPMESIETGDIFVDKGAGVCVCFQGMWEKEVVSLTLGCLVYNKVIESPVLLWREENGHF